MNFFFVFQNKSYLKEKADGYLWAPKRNKKGSRVSHWERMEEVKKGDLIIHSYFKKIVAVSIATTDAYSSIQPLELQEEKLWEDEGWRVDSKYFEIKRPIITSDHSSEILQLQPVHNAPFNSISRGNTGYLFSSNRELTMYLLLQTELYQEDKFSKNELHSIREKFGLLDFNELELLDDETLIENIKDLKINNDKPLSYNGTPRVKLAVRTDAKGTNSYPRKLNISVNALKMASFKCEADNNHPTFERKKDGNPYTEPHHLIPLSLYADFQYSLDVEENIISLCSHCHNLLHYGKDIKEVLKKLHDNRKGFLENAGIELTFERLLSYY